MSAFGFGLGVAVPSIHSYVASSQVSAQYLNNLSIIIGGGNLNATLPFNTSTLQNNNGSTATGVRIDFTITRPDTSTVNFFQTTDADGRIRGQLFATVLNQLGTYNINATVTGGSPTAAGTFTITEFAQLDRDNQVFTGNQQVFKNDANSATAFQVQNAAGVAQLTVDTTNSKVIVTNLEASGTITGNGSGLTTLNASNLSSGTVADARLSGNVTVQGNTFNGASQLVQLNGSSQLPAVSGALLINLNGSNVSSGTINDARLSANVTTQGNTFNGVNQLIQTTGAGALPVISGANLTSLNASSITLGVLSDARLSANVTTQGNSFNGPNQLVQLTGAGALPAVSGANLTNLNASNLSSGTVNDARLSTNVALLDRNNQTTTGSNQFFKNNTNTTTGFQVQNAAGLAQLTVDTQNGKVIITNLEAGTVTGDIDASNITSGTLSDARLSSNVALLNRDNQIFTGNDQTFRNTTGSNTGFQVQNSGGFAIISVDTENNRLGVGYANPQRALDVLGDAIFENVADSTSAFRIQNASSQGLLNIDSLNANITLNELNSGRLAGWQTNANALPATRYAHTSIVANGYVYVIGGVGGGSPQDTVYYAKLNADGSTSSWSTTTALPAARSDHTSVAANGYVYVIGGENGGVQSTVYYAKLNADGTVGTWSTNANALPAVRGQHASVVANGYVYVIGGENPPGTAQDTVYYAKLNADGSTGTWSTNANALPAARRLLISVVANGYVYAIGGYNAGAQSTVYYAKLNADGSTGTWSTNANALPAIRYGRSSVVANGYVYAIGGDTSGVTNTVIYAKLNADGSTGTWTTNANALPAVRDNHSSVVANGYVYAIGGNTGFAEKDTVYYASTSRLKFGGSLDLVGLGGQNLAEGGTGGSLTAGNTNIVGSLGVQDQASFAQGLSIDKDLRVSGSAFFKNATNSTSAFQIQNAAGGSLVNVDSTNANITLNGLNSGELQSWQTNANAITSARTDHASVTANGYVYVISGKDGAGTPQSTVYYAKLNADGSTGTWTTNANALTAARDSAVAAVANGYVYVLGGNNGGSQSTVYYAKLNSDGSTGTWSTNAQALPAARHDGSTIAYNGYLYYFGGYSSAAGAPQSTVYYAKLNADGSTGAWTTSGNPLTAARSGQGTVVANGYVYIIGGYDGATVNNNVYYAKLNADGSTSTWTLEGDTLPDTLQAQGSVVANGYVYAIGGKNTGGTIKATVYYAALNGDGSTGAWSTATNAVTAAREGLTSVIANGYVYALGGNNGGAQSTVYYSSTSRLKFGGSLDLVGLGGENLSEGGTGGSLAAGNTNIVGTLGVQDQASFAQGVAVGGDLAVNGSALFKNGTNSTTAFQVQKSAGDQLLNVDTSTTPNLINNPSLEVNTTGWVAHNSATISRTTSQHYIGNAALQVTTTAAANDGARFPITLNTLTTYSLRVWGRLSSGTFSTFQIGRSDDGAADTSCSTGNGLYTNSFIAVSCTFTTGGSISNSYIYAKQTDATGRTFYIDAIQLQTGSTATTFKLGELALNGIVTSPVIIQNSNNSSKAFEIADVAGNTLFQADTANATLGIGIDPTNDTKLRINTGYIGLRVNETGTSNILELQQSTVNVFSVSSTGAVLQKNSADSTTSFQVQNSAGGKELVIDTSNNQVEIGDASADVTGVTLILDTKNTNGDPTGVNGAMYYNSNNGTFRCYEQSAWTNCVGIPKPNTRRSFQATAPGSGTTMNAFGDVATASGTPCAAICQASTTEPAYIDFQSGAAAGNAAGVSGNTNYDYDTNPIFQTNVKVPTTTQARVWVGLTDQTLATMAASDNPAGRYAAFRYSTVASDSGWKCVTKDGTTQNVVDAATAMSTNYFKLEIDVLNASSTVIFKINGQQVCSMATNYPGGGNLARYLVSVTTNESLAKNIRTAWIYVESDQ